MSDIEEISKKKRSFKNIYCSTCNYWVAEYFLSCHLNSIAHGRRYKNQVQQPVQSSTDTDNMTIQTPEKTYDSYIIQGSTLKKRSFEVKNVLGECSDTSTRSPSPDIFASAKQRLFNTDAVSSTSLSPSIFSSLEQNLSEVSANEIKELPQNQLEIIDLMDYDDNPSNSEESPQSVCFLSQSTQRSENARDRFPLSLLSGQFTDKSTDGKYIIEIVKDESDDEDHLSEMVKDEPCQDDHLNQISFYKCPKCNPDCYLMYEKW